MSPPIGPRGEYRIDAARATCTSVQVRAVSAENVSGTRNGSANGIAPELERLAGNTDELDRLLSDGRWHPAPECSEAGGARFGGRIFDLRHGVGGRPKRIIEGRRVKGGLWEYRRNLEKESAPTVNRDSFRPAEVDSTPPPRGVQEGGTSKHVVRENNGQALLFGADTRSF